MLQIKAKISANKKKKTKKSSSKKTTKKENEGTVIHVKFDRTEAIQSKKDLLFAQRELLEILKHIKRYHLLRKKELTLKTKAKKRLQEVNKDFTDLKKKLPKVQKPEILKEEEKEKEEKTPEKVDHSNIDNELEEIQRKLTQLEHSTQVSQ